MLLNNWLGNALQQTWTSIFAKLIAIILLYGSTVHIGNILGWGGQPWRSTPLLWRGFAWSVWLLFGGIALLQFVPYTLLRSQFILEPSDAQTLNGLLGTEALLLSFFALLLWLKK